MLNIRVGTLDARRIARIQRALSSFKSGDLLKKVKTNDLAYQTLQYLIDISTERGSRREEIRRFAKSRTRERLMSVSDGWRIKRDTATNKIFFQITNILATSGGTKGRARMMAIEYGSKRTQFIVKRAFTFLGDYGWNKMSVGRIMTHAATKPKNYLGKTSDFIRSQMMPEIRKRIIEAHKREMDNL